MNECPEDALKYNYYVYYNTTTTIIRRCLVGGVDAEEPRPVVYDIICKSSALKPPPQFFRYKGESSKLNQNRGAGVPYLYRGKLDFAEY